MEHVKLYLGVIDGEIDPNSTEGRYMPTLVLIKACYHNKSCLLFILELNDQKQDRNLLWRLNIF